MEHPLRFWKRWRRSDADFSEEIAAHLRLEADRLIAEGFSPEDAIHEARRRFGNVGQAQERFHRRRTVAWIEMLPQQLRRAVRRLAAAPLFSVTALLTLGLGIGATTAVFSLVNGVLLRPLPFSQPERLVDLTHTMVLQGISQVDQSDATYLYYRDANQVFSGVGAWRSVSVNLSPEGDRSAAERLPAARLSAGTFAVLGIAPLRGRVLLEAEDAGDVPVVVIGERLWKNRYGSEPGIVGRNVTLDGIAHQVVGIMPEQFAFPDERTALWLPAGIDRTKTESATFSYRAIARLRPGVTLAQASADLDRLLPRVPDAYPGRLTAAAIELTKMRSRVIPLRDTVVGGVERVLWVVFAAGAFLLLIACANVANLFLVRGEARHHDLLVRRALGAGRGPIVAEFLSEGLVLSLLGGIVGLGLARLALGVLRSFESSLVIPRLANAALDWSVLTVAAGVTLLTALVMSLVPALRVSSPRVTSLLVQSGPGSTSGRQRHRALRAFVVLQMALALVLVTGAGLMARSLWSLRAIHPGFEAAGASTFRVALPEASYPGAAGVVGLIWRALDRVAALPGVQAVGAISKLPLEADQRRDTAVFVEDRPLAMGQMPNVHQVVYATPGAFTALSIPFREGGTFEHPDPSRAPLEVIVTQALARRYWGTEPAVGRRLRLSPRGPLFTVTGVTGDIRGTGLDQSPDEIVFLPLVTAPGPATAAGGAGEARFTPRELAFVVRSASSANDPAGSIGTAFRELAPALPIYGLGPLSEVVARSTGRTRFTLELLQIASLAAVLIGAVGLYGVVSYMVSLRGREMAVRIAVGAEPKALRRMVMTQAIVVAALGILLGLLAVIPLSRFLAVLLYNVAPTDAISVGAAAAIMAVVGIAASWFPARRAALTDPAVALRTDI